MKWLRSLFCRHKFSWVRNIHGDEINFRNGKRSEWVCCKCDKYQYRRGLADKP